MDPETGEISLPQDPAAVRLERFALQSVARSILPKARTAKCLRVPFARSVGVFHSQAQESAHYGGLVTCASVWACPICAAKISERRRLFREYAECFKGKRQLVWSRGLRELLGLEDISDEDLASRQEEDAYLLANLTLEQWRIIRQSDRRGELLEVARHGDPQALNRYLDAITSRP